MMIKRGTETTITFALVSATDGSAITSGTVTVYLSKDGGAQAASSNSAIHLGNGQWAITLTATEMDAGVISVLATHAAAVNAHLLIPTAVKLVSDLNDPTVAAIRSEIDANSTKINTIAGDVENIDGAAMRGTDGANTTTPPTTTAIASAVWGAATRTLTAFSFNVTVGNIVQAALAKFATTDTGETTVAAGSVAKLSQDAPVAGAIQHTHTFNNTDTGQPIPDADVWVTLDEAGTVVKESGRTNDDGEYTFMLDAGVQYYAWLEKTGVTSIQADPFTAAEDP